MAYLCWLYIFVCWIIKYIDGHRGTFWYGWCCTEAGITRLSICHHRSPAAESPRWAHSNTQRYRLRRDDSPNQNEFTFSPHPHTTIRTSSRHHQWPVPLQPRQGRHSHRQTHTIARLPFSTTFLSETEQTRIPNLITQEGARYLNLSVRLHTNLEVALMNSVQQVAQHQVV